MNGTRLRVAKDTWEPLDKKNNAPDYKPINATKLVAPVYGIWYSYFNGIYTYIG